MRIRHELLAMRPSLRWSRLVLIALCLISGILGMHVISSMPTGSMAPACMVSVGTASNMMTQPAPVATQDGHHVDMATGGASMLEPSQSGVLCECSPTACHASMDMHQGCVPLPGSTVVNVSLPGTLTYLAAGAAFLATPGYKSADRSPDPPSLTQLSISRT